MNFLTWLDFKRTSWNNNRKEKEVQKEYVGVFFASGGSLVSVDNDMP